MSFLVDDMRRLRGGVAGNIAWNLALLGAQPVLVATAGQDFAEYKAVLDASGVDTSRITVIPEEFTASCFINTDLDANQIVAFYAGALSHGHRIELGGLGLGPGDLVVISPTDPASMARAVEACRAARVPYLFDPGKQTPRLEEAQILEGMASAAVVVGNDYEFGLMAQKTDRTEAQLQSIAPVTVVTRCEQGSVVRERGKPPIEVPVARSRALCDPPGVVGAYPGGLVLRMACRLPWSCRARRRGGGDLRHRGARVQEHRYTHAEFLERYRSAFGDAAPVAAAFGRQYTSRRRSAVGGTKGTTALRSSS